MGNHINEIWKKAHPWASPPTFDFLTPISLWRRIFRRFEDVFCWVLHWISWMSPYFYFRFSWSTDLESVSCFCPLRWKFPPSLKVARLSVFCVGNSKTQVIAESILVPTGREIAHARKRSTLSNLYKILWVVDIAELIICSNSGDDWLSSFGVARGKIVPFPIDFDRLPYNTVALLCEYLWYL